MHPPVLCRLQAAASAGEGSDVKGGVGNGEGAILTQQSSPAKGSGDRDQLRVLDPLEQQEHTPTTTTHPIPKPASSGGH